MAASRHALTCSGYKPLLRQYSASSVSGRAAVSTTTANVVAADQFSLLRSGSGTGRPSLRNCLRQLYKVASEMPSCLARAGIVGGFEDNILFRIDCLRACGMDDIVAFQPPGLEKCRNRQLTNYPDSGGYWVL